MVTTDDIISSVKTELGHPVVSICMSDDQIKVAIDKAIRRCAGKAAPVKMVTRNVVGGMVDMSDLDVATVKMVYQGCNSGSSEIDIFDADAVMLATTLSGGSMSGGYNRISDLAAKLGTLAEIKKLALSDFYYIDGKLYLDNYSGEVSIEYVKREVTIEELPTDWVSWVEAYTVALCKMIEGRIRGKFKRQNAPFENDADALIGEGQSSLSDLEQRLDMKMGYWTILR